MQWKTSLTSPRRRSSREGARQNLNTTLRSVLAPELLVGFDPGRRPRRLETLDAIDREIFAQAKRDGKLGD